MSTLRELLKELVQAEQRTQEALLLVRESVFGSQARAEAMNRLLRAVQDEIARKDALRKSEAARTQGEA